MSAETELNDLFLILGMATGLMSRRDNYAALVESLKRGVAAGGVHPAYIGALRDRLDGALADSGVEYKTGAGR